MGGGGKILEEALLMGLGGFLGVVARWGSTTTKRVVRVLEDLQSFWVRDDQPILGTSSFWNAFGGFFERPLRVFLEGLCFGSVFGTLLTIFLEDL